MTADTGEDRELKERVDARQAEVQAQKKCQTSPQGKNGRARVRKKSKGEVTN